MFDFSYKQHTTASKNSFKRDIQVLKTMGWHYNKCISMCVLINV